MHFVQKYDCQGSMESVAGFRPDQEKPMMLATDHAALFPESHLAWRTSAIRLRTPLLPARLLRLGHRSHCSHPIELLKQLRPLSSVSSLKRGALQHAGDDEGTQVVAARLRRWMVTDSGDSRHHRGSDGTQDRHSATCHGTVWRCAAWMLRHPVILVQHSF